MYRFIIPVLLFITLPAAAQKEWHLLPPVPGKSFGVDAIGAAKMLQGKKPTPVIVAVIDNGTQITHKTLQPYIWTNKGEVENNNKDDDGNGYTDDVHGWSFLGGKGGDINYEADEETREYFALKKKYDTDSSSLAEGEKQRFYAAKTKYLDKDRDRVASAKMADKLYKKKDNIILKALGKRLVGESFEKDLAEFKEFADSLVVYNRINTDSLRRLYVGDNPDSLTERYYGNNHIDVANPAHGTHTAGTVMSVARCADSGRWLKIMPIRAIPNGDERDKDVANAIRYAVDNGAAVINMSFGKYTSPGYAEVAKAIRYAQEKDVLLVHSAGNDAMELADSVMDNYPNARIDSLTLAGNFIQVGATGNNPKKLVAGFSNYGRYSVDIMAPGVNIYATVPVDTFAKYSGTSMAGPVVAGVAAMLRSYYPQLTAVQVKTILMQTATKTTQYADVPGRRKTIAQLWYFCRAGGIVNAAAAIQLAENRHRATL